eukprot:CAMPEP_0119148218 /NCGR_PEP_ID=MMETSP1310-20130426/41516_1 /TAXON_ID=464262 /ORGANISM="Genus nov. species nov., Strain RCC2339" /LENGTH=60 /DNA_ID=CAMNT_0007140243 /DNA_START=3 /DNA_END=181 /DNA_ORIENTATION=+
MTELRERLRECKAHYKRCSWLLESIKQEQACVEQQIEELEEADLSQYGSDGEATTDEGGA